MKLATRYFNKKNIINKQEQEEGFMKQEEEKEKEEEEKEVKEAYDNNAKRIEVETNEEIEKNAEDIIRTSDADRNINNHDEWAKKMVTLYHFIHQIIMIFCRQCENTELESVQFFLMAGQNANYCGFEETAFELYLDAFRVYEDSVSHSRAQFNAIVYSIGSLLKTSPRLQKQHFNTLSTKLSLYSTKLLKKPDQSRAVYLSSHLWTNGETPSRVIECLQKSFKIADSCMDIVTNEILFLELLNQYIYYFEKEQSLVSLRALSVLANYVINYGFLGYC